MRIERNQIDSAADIRQLEQIYSQGTRYVKVNLQSYWRHGTVEFRQHHGTINATKIEAWIKIVLSICAVSESPLTVRTVGNLTEMVSKLKLSRDDLAFLQRRQVELSRITSHERV